MSQPEIGAFTLASIHDLTSQETCTKSTGSWSNHLQAADRSVCPSVFWRATPSRGLGIDEVVPDGIASHVSICRSGFVGKSVFLRAAGLLH